MGAAPAALGGDATVQLSCKHCFHKHCFHDQVALPWQWPGLNLGFGLGIIKTRLGLDLGFWVGTRNLNLDLH